LTTPVDPRPLALARIGVGVTTLLNFVNTYGSLLHVADGKIAMPLWSGLPEVTETSAAVLTGVAVLACVAVILGLGTRPAAAVIAVATWLAFGWEQQTYSNHMMLGAWLALWLVFSRADAVWSLRSRIEGQHAVELADQVLLMTQLSVCYLFAALVKLNAGFLSGDELRTFVGLDLPEAAYPVLAVGAVVTELSLAVGLWLARVRWVVAVAGLGLHVSIPLAMSGVYELTSFSLLCLSLYPMFLALPHPAPHAARTRQSATA
jgi:hypothetical protein